MTVSRNLQKAHAELRQFTAALETTERARSRSFELLLAETLHFVEPLS